MYLDAILRKSTDKAIKFTPANHIPRTIAAAGGSSIWFICGTIAKHISMANTSIEITIAKIPLSDSSFNNPQSIL